MTGGPLIPGMREFDGPKKGVPVIVWWILGLIIILAVALTGLGAFAASGPMHSLGEVTKQLQPVAYRSTTSDRLMQVAVNVPTDGVCRRDPVDVALIESADTISLAFSVTSARNTTCALADTPDNRLWVDVPLGAPVGSRHILRAEDGQELLTDSAAALG